MVLTSEMMQARPQLIQQVFSEDDYDLDDIAPYADVDAESMLSVLQIRRAIGHRLIARRENLALAVIHDTEAEEAEDQLQGREWKPFQERRLEAVTERARAQADGCRFKARHMELEIMAHFRQLER